MVSINAEISKEDVIEVDVVDLKISLIEVVS